MLRFDDRVVLISGAGRGLGRAYAELLASRGAKVAINDLGTNTDGAGADGSPSEEVCAKIRAAGGEAIANHADVSRPEGAVAAVQATIDAYGRLDVLINNAGIFKTRDFPEADVDDLRQHLEAHVVAPFNLTRTAWPYLAASPSPRVILITSVAVFGMLGYASYATAKSAILGLTMNLAVAGEPQGIKVNAISPIADTRMALAGGVTQEQLDSLGPEEMRRRQPDRVAPLVAALAHESCSRSGRIYEAGHGRFAEVFVAECQGYTDLEATIDDVNDHWSEIEDRAEFWVPSGGFSALPIQRVLATTGF